MALCSLGSMKRGRYCGPANATFVTQAERRQRKHRVRLCATSISPPKWQIPKMAMARVGGWPREITFVKGNCLLIVFGPGWIAH